MKRAKQTTTSTSAAEVYIGFKVPPNIHKLIRMLAVEKDTSVSSLMRELAIKKAVEINTVIKKGSRK
jgi:hypothetical protein